MKRCPQCNRTYADDALSFCLDDGSPLAASPDPSATVQYPQARDTTPQPTIAYNPNQPPPAPPPAWSPMPSMRPKKRSAWPWVLGIGTVLFLIAAFVVGLVIAVVRITNDNSNRVANSNNSNWRLANRNSNKNTNDNTNENANEDSNENSNSRSTLTSTTDDFSTPNWGTGTWTDGRAWYEDDEYHMHAIGGRFIMMYAPKRPEYKTKNSTVRVTLRSVDGNPPTTGYGLIVHGEKKDNGDLEDYGFLIRNHPNPEYEIVLHKGGKETAIVSWTPSSVIRAGTSTNQIEVRIRDLRLDLYINGQFVTSITDTANYKNGLVGLYTSDVGEVAFDDLEISR